MNTFSLQTRLYSGQGSLAVLKRFTNKHIWIICDGFLARSPLLDTLRNALPADNRISVFSEITPDPTIHTVVQALRKCRPATAGGDWFWRRLGNGRGESDCLV